MRITIEFELSKADALLIVNDRRDFEYDVMAKLRELYLERMGHQRWSFQLNDPLRSNIGNLTVRYGLEVKP